MKDSNNVLQCSPKIYKLTMQLLNFAFDCALWRKETAITRKEEIDNGCDKI